MPAAGDEGCGTRTDGYFLQKHVCFPRRGGNLAAKLNRNDKIDRIKSDRFKLYDSIQ